MQLLREFCQPGLDGERAVTTLQDELDSNVPIFEALVCETHSAALLTAAITSAVNAFSSEATEKREVGLRPFTPREPTLATDLRNGMIETDLDEETTIVISDFFAALAPARIALDQYFADARHIGPERASGLHLVALADTWHRACENALAAIEIVQQDIAQRLPTQYRINSRVLANMLADAARGGSPCLDPQGRICLPDLPQRRTSARRTLRQPCIVTSNGKAARAFVGNVSSNGVGLERVPQLQPENLVLIEFLSGRRLSGVVTWCDGSSAGVQLSTELLANDPLLSG